MELINNLIMTHNKQSLVNDYKNLSYIEQCNFYTRLFGSACSVSGTLEIKLQLIHLVCLVTQRMRKTNPDMSVLSVLSKITGLNLETDERVGLSEFLYNLSIICEDFLYGVSKDITIQGYSSASEIISEIRRILNDEWLPF